MSALILDPRELDTRWGLGPSVKRGLLGSACYNW
jgi:hypothetical protein